MNYWFTAIDRVWGNPADFRDDNTMSEYREEMLEAHIETSLELYDKELGIDESGFSRLFKLESDSSADVAFIEMIEMIGSAWETIVKSAFYTGYELGRNGGYPDR